MVWYSQLFKNFPQLVVIHTVKSFSVVNETEVDAFLELSSFSMIQNMFAVCPLVPLSFLNPAWACGSSQFTCFWSPAWRILSITLLACEISEIVWQSEHSLTLTFFGIGMKLTFSSPVATAEFSKFAGILSAALSEHHLLGFEIAQLEFHHFH